MSVCLEVDGRASRCPLLPPDGSRTADRSLPCTPLEPLSGSRRRLPPSVTPCRAQPHGRHLHPSPPLPQHPPETERQAARARTLGLILAPSGVLLGAARKVDEKVGWARQEEGGPSEMGEGEIRRRRCRAWAEEGSDDQQSRTRAEGTRRGGGQEGSSGRGKSVIWPASREARRGARGKPHRAERRLARFVRSSAGEPPPRRPPSPSGRSTWPGPATASTRP